MDYLIGIVLALMFTSSATVLGLDRERVFYLAVMIAVATYYVLFAAMSGSGHVVIVESAAAAGFLVFAMIGFKTSLWLVAVALTGHGIFDFFHHFVIDDPGVPPWWPGFCMAFDIVAAGYLAGLLMKRPGLARPDSLASGMS